MPRAPYYGSICISCGQMWPLQAPGVTYNSKHDDPATGEKCRDMGGTSSGTFDLGPVAELPYGPEGIIRAIEEEAEVGLDWLNVSTEERVDIFKRSFQRRLYRCRKALGFSDDVEIL